MININIERRENEEERQIDNCLVLMLCEIFTITMFEPFVRRTLLLLFTVCINLVMIYYLTLTLEEEYECVL